MHPSSFYIFLGYSHVSTRYENYLASLESSARFATDRGLRAEPGLGLGGLAEGLLVNLIIVFLASTGFMSH